MIIDSSAILAILYFESDAGVYSQAIKDAKIRRISAATYVEISILTDAQGIGHKLDALMRSSKIVIEPVTEEQAKIARQAYRDFGKGNHKARLNYGDSFAYALAVDLGEPLLYKGDDFARTDVESALVAQGS